MGLLLLITYSALYLNPDYKKEYVAGIIPKITKLKQVKVKKIVIIGGSNASFGIDTDLMERELGLPVINLALHGGLPIKYIVEQAKEYMNEGDILIFSKEYEGLKDRHWNVMNGIELSKVATYDWSQARILFSDRTLFETTISGIFGTIKRYIERYPVEGRKNITSVYDSRAFEKDNLLGEYISGEYGLKVEEHPLGMLNSDSKILSGLKEYKLFFEKKGVQFYITPPVVIKGYFKEENVLPFWYSFSENTGIPLLNMDKKYTYDKRYFFNSHYHTNQSGRKLRTESLISDIIGAGLGIKSPQKNKTVYLSKSEALNEVNLASFNAPYNFDILRRDDKEIRVRQSGDLGHNYFRIRFENKDYKGYNFYLHLKCDREVIENIKFRGTGKLVNFDTIINLGQGNYGVWKKVDKVVYKNGNSYLGIAFPENEALINKEFTIKEVGVYRNFGKEDVMLEVYPLEMKNGERIFFEVLSKNEDIALADIISSQDNLERVVLKIGTLYEVEKSNGLLSFRDFYSGELLFRTNNAISFSATTNTVVKIKI
tara:strand:- start:7662 stop:9287 length:1626 start_codon:yes stop_codon:yes gene_type:complete